MNICSAESLRRNLPKQPWHRMEQQVCSPTTAPCSVACLNNFCIAVTEKAPHPPPPLCVDSGFFWCLRFPSAFPLGLWELSQRFPVSPFVITTATTGAQRLCLTTKLLCRPRRTSFILFSPAMPFNACGDTRTILGVTCKRLPSPMWMYHKKRYHHAEACQHFTGRIITNRKKRKATC